MLQQAYGQECLSHTQCHEWYQRFKTGRTSVKDDPKFGQPSMSMDDNHIEKELTVVHQNRRLTVREVAEGGGICKILCHLILTGKLQMRRVAPNLCHVCWRVTPYPWIFYEAWDDCCPLASLLSRFGPCGPFLVLGVEILTKRLLISEGSWDRRKFDTGSSRRPAKHVSGRVPEMEKKFRAVYQEWRGVLWRWQF